ncbi:MAG: ankyrin repeat domain-containing protein [Treponema sp.]|nr:ankyrin repeat domain-containing protein [Treponema sp.]
MKICPTCNKEFPDDVNFCKYDGTPLEEKKFEAGKKCPKCGMTNPASAGFCMACGAKLVEKAEEPKCPKCGTTTKKKTTDKVAIEKAKADGMKKAFDFLSDIGMNLDDEIDGEIPVLYAAENGENEILQALLAAGADADRPDDEGNTPLMKAVESNENKAVKILIDNGADVNIENDYEETALSFARLSNNKYIVGLLRKAGAID